MTALAPTLRPKQVAALDAIVTARANGMNRLLVKAPTGTGKTVTFAALPAWPGLQPWLSTFALNDRRMLVIAHREELLTQAAEKIQTANPGLIVSIEQAELRAHSFSDVVVASIQSLSAMKFKRLHRLIAHRPFRIVIVDEAHHAAAPSYRTALVHLGFLPPADVSEKGEIEAADFDDVKLMAQALESWDRSAPTDRLLVGFTATPNRTDAIGLGCVFQTIAYSYDLKTAIDDRWLVPITPWVVETKAALDDVGMVHGDFNQRELADAVNNGPRNALAVAAWQEYAAGLSTIAFTVNVAHAHALAAAFTAVGVTAAAISGETPKDERRETLAAYTRGDILIICNCMVLTEGTDLPRTGCILHAKPTKSPTLFEQMTGRGLRIHPGKTECVVIDLVDVTRRHSLQTAPVLYGLPPGVKADGQPLDQMAEAYEAFVEAHPNLDLESAFKAGRYTLAQLEAMATTFDIWSVASLGDFGVGRALNWLKVGADEFRLQYPWADGTEILAVLKDMLGRWRVSLTLRPKGVPGGAAPPARQRTIALDIDSADAAAGLAEAFVLKERRSVAKLTDAAAPWRAKTATPKQLAFLTKLRVPHTPKGLTMGAASDLINLAKARRGR